MKNIFAIIAVLFSLSLSAYSQTEEERTEIAKTYLDKMSSKNKGYSTIKTSFSVTIDNKQNNSKTELKGDLSVKGNKYKLDFMNSITFFDGSTICTWLVEDKEANITDAEENPEAMIGPMQLLGAYDKGYKMRYIDDMKIDSHNCVNIDLYPIDHKTNIARVRLTIDKDTYTIRRIMQQGKDGTSYYVNVDSFKTNLSIPDSEFSFDAQAHPDVEVVDMR